MGIGNTITLVCCTLSLIGCTMHYDKQVFKETKETEEAFHTTYKVEINSIETFESYLLNKSENKIDLHLSQGLAPANYELLIPEELRSQISLDNSDDRNKLVVDAQAKIIQKSNLLVHRAMGIQPFSGSYLNDVLDIRTHNDNGIQLRIKGDSIEFCKSEIITKSFCLNYLKIRVPYYFEIRYFKKRRPRES